MSLRQAEVLSINLLAQRAGPEFKMTSRLSPQSPLRRVLAFRSLLFLCLKIFYKHLPHPPNKPLLFTMKSQSTEGVILKTGREAESCLIMPMERTWGWISRLAPEGAPHINWHHSDTVLLPTSSKCFPIVTVITEAK